MSHRPCSVLPAGLEHTGQVAARPQPCAEPASSTALSQLAGSSPHGYFRSLPPLRAAYSHSASVGSRPPAQRENAAACSPLPPTAGWSSPVMPASSLKAEQAPAATQARYCLLVTKVLAMENEGTLT